MNVGRTTGEVAAAIGRTEREAEWLLRDCRRRGLVERVGDRWRLTAEAERRYGRALRAMRGER